MLDSLGEWQLSTKLDLYQIQCNATVPDLVFTIGGIEYTVPSDDLVITDETGQFCFFAVARMKYAMAGARSALDEQLATKLSDLIPGDDGPVPLELKGNTWLVGDSFLRQYYTIYDAQEEKFGLATLA